MNNPYRVGTWVVGSEFYNRADLLRDILAESTAGMWIIGNRRVGKTSLLKEAERRAANSAVYLPLFWDMQGDTREAQLIESLLEAIEYAQSAEIDKRWRAIDLPENTLSLSQVLRQVATYAQQYQSRLLLLCDEIEGLNQLGQQEPHVLSKLRRVLQHNPAIRAILTSTRRLSRLYAIQQQHDTSLFLEGFEPRYLAHFDDDTTNQLICCAQSAYPLKIDKTLLAQIQIFTGNHPLILQKICHHLFDLDTRSLRLFDEVSFCLDDQLCSTFRQDFDSLSPDEAKIMLLINSQVRSLSEIEQTLPHLSPSSLRRMLYDLNELGFLRRTATGAYQAGNVLLGEWLAAEPDLPVPQGGVTNRMLKGVAQERVAALQRQILACVRHLGQLELRQAKQGLETPPHIITEIEEYKAKIAAIEAELAELAPHTLA